MNELEIFNNPEFGEIRTMQINNEPWFVGKDVAVALGYKDTSDALKRHVDDEDKLTQYFSDSGQNREMYIINESGMYSLVLSSKLSKAKKFKHWVTSEVLPAIRKHRFYTIDDMLNDPDAIINALQAYKKEKEEKLAPQRNIINKELTIFNADELNQLKEIEINNKNKYTGFFYILEYGDLIKIGSTKSPYIRIMTLKRQAEKYGDKNVGRVAISIPHTNFTDNEKRLHIFFSEYRKSGTELFNLPFDNIVCEVNSVVEYEDNTNQLEQKSKYFLNGMKKFILGV